MNHGNRTPAERSIIYGMAMKGATLEAVNQALEASGARPLPMSSYRSIVRDYVPYLEGDSQRLGRAIVHPPTWSQLGRSMPASR